jgi:hypothetical protein
MNDISTVEVIPTLLEIIRQHAPALDKSGLQDVRRELHDAAFTIAIAANSGRLHVEKILDAIAQLACELRRRHDVLSMSPTDCERLEQIMAINPKLADSVLARIREHDAAIEKMALEPPSEETSHA